MRASNLTALAAMFGSGCQAAALPAADPLTGSWGGQHIGLELGPGGGRLDYDCAAGTIHGPVRADASGRFRAEGTHSAGQGGPERIGHVPPSLPATYTGSVRGGTMTLRVRVQGTGMEMGPYTLTRGAEPIILRCL